MQFKKTYIGLIQFSINFILVDCIAGSETEAKQIGTILSSLSETSNTGSSNSGWDQCAGLLQTEAGSSLANDRWGDSRTTSTHVVRVHVCQPAINQASSIAISSPTRVHGLWGSPERWYDLRSVSLKSGDETEWKENIKTDSKQQRRLVTVTSIPMEKAEYIPCAHVGLR